MALDVQSQEDREENNTQYTSSGYDKAKLSKTIFVIVGIFIAICIVVLIAYFSTFKSQNDKYIDSATAAARKEIPNAKVSDIKVDGGFALAIVSDQTSDSQLSAGNTTIFKVNKDGSMKQLAIGSSFSPIDLLGFGIPLKTQAKLTGKSVDIVKQTLRNMCGYYGDTPGYNGFNASFNPDNWQIDSASLDGLEQALTTVVSAKNNSSKPEKKVICINATRNNSNATTDLTTYISTFTLDVQFITDDGTLTTHTITFVTGPSYYREYTLDGQKI